MFGNTLAQAGKSSLLGWGMVFLFVVLNVLGALLLKNEIHKIGSWSLTSTRSFLVFFVELASSWKIFIAVGLLFGSTIAWSIALANLELSRAYPVGIGLHFLMIMCSAMLIYGESITLLKAVGACLIIIGMIIFLKC
jgi:multidrug transporter EmrE-like cation transporter